jgi:hypothetical protein
VGEVKADSTSIDFCNSEFIGQMKRKDGARVPLSPRAA